MLQLYNTMTRQKGPFRPLNNHLVKIFSCGPSIYAPPHIGNYRTFIWEDVLQRYLKYLGYEVKRTINLTDLEDKAIEEAGERGISVGELTSAVAMRFLNEARRLRIELPDKLPRSSTSIEQAVYLIGELMKKGYAYRYRGDIFFDPLKFKDFGKLFRLDMSKWPKKKTRFKRDTYPGRRWNLGDFILWHGFKKRDSVYWETPVGKGRPAWNVQDPAMISQTLGYSLDIFCGGVDNLYRHHDYNIAVMESVSGVELARYWLHGEHVLVGGKKMSKSLGNIVYPEDLLGRGFSWEQIRFYLLSRHYRKKLNLSMDELREASLRLDTVREIVAGLLSGARPVESVNDGASNELAGELKVSFETRMNNDLDTATAIDKVFKTVERLHSLHKAGKIGAERSLAIGAQLLKIDSVLQVLF
jgi:cysteinyl-tRNA synthetase